MHSLVFWFNSLVCKKIIAFCNCIFWCLTFLMLEVFKPFASKWFEKKKKKNYYSLRIHLAPKSIILIPTSLLVTYIFLQIHDHYCFTLYITSSFCPARLTCFFNTAFQVYWSNPLSHKTACIKDFQVDGSLPMTFSSLHLLPHSSSERRPYLNLNACQWWMLCLDKDKPSCWNVSSVN